MSINNYLRCTKIKDGYFSREDIIEWIETIMLPAIREQYNNRTMVIILDNIFVHASATITDPILAAGHIIKYLLPYSPNFNPIKLTFGVSKAWIRRNYWRHRHELGFFGEWLRYVVNESQCDKFAVNQLRHARTAYILKGKLRRGYRERLDK